ncbi:MAG: serine protease [Tannerellaceae bacterium]|jgi:hypothetical protein|nr:serine protease [Tannerellaceae bacterium]
MKRIFFILSALLSCAVVSAQVYEYYFFENRDAFQTFPQLKPVSESLLIKSMPLFNIDSLLAEDKELEGLDVPFRFGHAFDVDYTLNDGKWMEEDGKRIWRSRFYSKGAYSINFAFSEMILVPEAELYIFSTDGAMVYGPVTERQNIETGEFLTTLVAGDDVVIQLIEPAASKEKSRLSISRVVHAYVNTYPELNNEGVRLLTCHNDVCNYPAWEEQSNGVGGILLSGGAHHCSGALLNNTSQNVKPYFLTAYHCLDSSVTSWAFRFQYKSSTCNKSAITYNGCNQRAGWSNTDFLLVELNQSIVSNDLTFLGWDRSSSASSTGTTIHHPQGAQMKISFDNNSLSSTGNFWSVTYDSGTTEGGSSGAPLFNTAQRVIGQLRGGDDGCPPNVTDIYGRLDKSWTGGGTNASRLSNWLDPNGTGATSLNSLVQISGPDLVPCSGTVTYSLPASYASSTVTWTVTPLQIVSGQGTNTIIVQRSSSSTSNSASISVTVTPSGSSSVLTKSVDIGVPHITSLTGPSSAKVGIGASFTAAPVFTQGDYQWTVTPSTATMTPYRQTCSIIFNAVGAYQVGVRSTSSCTTPGSYTTTTVSVSTNYIVSSETGKQVTVALPSGVTASTTQTIAWTLHNQTTGALAASGRIVAQGGALDFDNLPVGVYVLSLDTESGVPDTHKIILK